MDRIRIGSHVDHDLRHYSFARHSGLPMDYYRKQGRIDWSGVWDVIAVVLAIGVIVWALLPWGHL
jgi:hypothetical protein